MTPEQAAAWAVLLEENIAMRAELTTNYGLLEKLKIDLTNLNEQLLQVIYFHSKSADEIEALASEADIAITNAQRRY